MEHQPLIRFMPCGLRLRHVLLLPGESSIDANALIQKG
jgi:hypothetical protein